MFRFATALGTCGLRWDASGLTHVHLPGEPGLGGGGPDRAPDPVRAAAEAITRLLEGAPEDLRGIRLSDRALDPFAARVYAATRAVGPGRTTSYGAIARALGQPGAARAVGVALGANRWPIVVPCHRVLAADGALTGFSAPGGVATKRRMLEIERAPGFAQASLFAV